MFSQYWKLVVSLCELFGIIGNKKTLLNENLKQFLYSTHERVLVEASPVDKIWGIGLAANHEHVQNPLLWDGLNLLGFALMDVRKQLF